MPPFGMQHVESLSFGLVVISRREPQDVRRAVLICMDKLCLLTELLRLRLTVAWMLLPLRLGLWN